MAGTKIGGLKAAATNKEKHGPDFFARIGKIGGSAHNRGGFASDIKCQCSEWTGVHYKRNCAGKLGGTISRRTKVPNKA